MRKTLVLRNPVHPLNPVNCVKRDTVGVQIPINLAKLRKCLHSQLDKMIKIWHTGASNLKRSVLWKSSN